MSEGTRTQRPSPISEETRFLALHDGIELESGELFSPARVAFRTWGEQRSAAILVCHALTGSADADDWWGALFGPGRTFDPERHFIVCANVLGGCYGTSGPTTPMAGGRRRYGSRFPRITIRDMVRLQAQLLERLGVERLELVVGGSMGGMQALEWAALYPERVEAYAVLSSSARHSAWCIGLGEAQRQTIRADHKYRRGDYRLHEGPRQGLAAARMMAMLSYRSWQGFESRFGRVRRDDERFEVESYLRYQGQKLVDRFDANSYLRLTEAMDSHDLGRGRGGTAEALAAIRQPGLVVGVTSDLLYPLHEQEELATHLPGARLEVIDAPHGHDTFLIETETVDGLLSQFLDDLQGASELRRAG